MWSVRRQVCGSKIELSYVSFTSFGSLPSPEGLLDPLAFKVTPCAPIVE